jgi:hypothetical protein
MKRVKPDLHWLVLSLAAVAFFASGAKRFHAANDFVPVYTGARCLLHNCNPYDTKQLEQQFFQAGGHPGELPSWDVDVPVYPPSTFLALSPLALFPFPVARLVWFLINSCLFVLSAAMILSLCPPPYRWLATGLASFFLLTGGILLVLGQPAIFAVSLLVIGCCLFLRSRYLPVATALWVLSLSVKPQIGGLMILYFVVQRLHARYGAMAMAGAFAVLVSAGIVLSAHTHSAHWPGTLQTNLSSTLSPGGSADPRPANPQAIGDTNLQALTSIWVTDAHAFNLCAYALFASLLLAWIMAVPWKGARRAMHLPALAALAVLSLLPVYHRFYDTRLLLLTVPAVLMVFQRRRVLGALIAGFTVLASISLQYRVQDYLLRRDQWHTLLQHKVLFLFLLRQQTLELLLLFFLYLAATRQMLRDPLPLAS